LWRTGPRDTSAVRRRSGLSAHPAGTRERCPSHDRRPTLQTCVPELAASPPSRPSSAARAGRRPAGERDSPTRPRPRSGRGGADRRHRQLGTPRTNVLVEPSARRWTRSSTSTPRGLARRWSLLHEHGVLEWRRLPSRSRPGQQGPEPSALYGYLSVKEPS
jgi:hypothetical protein